MTDKHPMTPPTELLTRWENDWFNEREHADFLLVNAYAAGAQAGADQELEACVSWLIKNQNPRWALALQDARRPKPPSLKKQALEELDAAILRGDCFSTSTAKDTIKRALEALPND